MWTSKRKCLTLIQPRYHRPFQTSPRLHSLFKTPPENPTVCKKQPFLKNTDVKTTQLKAQTNSEGIKKYLKYLENEKTKLKSVKKSVKKNADGPVQSPESRAISAKIGPAGDITFCKSTAPPVYNDYRIQMIPDSLRDQLFKQPKAPPDRNTSLKELHKFGLAQGKCEVASAVDIRLPPSVKDLEHHFDTISSEQTDPYLPLIKQLVSMKHAPSPPREWSREPGWTQYTEQGPVRVDYPPCTALVFDVEVCIADGNQLPALATALSPHYFYSWTSPGLDAPWLYNNVPTVDMMIPLGADYKVVVGHNVMYDRARVAEEYRVQRTKVRFVDTMSLHICVSGLESSQRGVWLQRNKGEEAGEDGIEEKWPGKWMQVGSPNSLAACYKLYCSKTLDKSARDTFVKGTHEEVRAQFNELTSYCAGDVLSTQEVLGGVWPLFAERFPSPTTLAGMFVMASCYIPVNQQFDRYIKQSEDMYQDYQREVQQLLVNLADEALAAQYGEKGKEDIWLSQLKTDSKKAIGLKNKKLSVKAQREEDERREEESGRVCDVGHAIHAVEQPEKLKHYVTAQQWYRDLCPKAASYTDTIFTRGASLISPLTQVSPLLLKLTWKGHPVWKTPHHGWGYLVSNDTATSAIYKCLLSKYYPDVTIIDLSTSPDVPPLGEVEEENYREEIEEQIELLSKLDDPQVVFTEHTFHKIDLKTIQGGNVGNPLSKGFADSIENGTLGSEAGSAALRVLDLGSRVSYWRSARSRISTQLIVSSQGENGDKMGVILPQAAPAGTLTRRATESTWLTASNVHKDRVGSEFKGMVCAMPGHSFVGADVDSQELWIASLLGDSDTGQHGATPIGWMTLQGQKSLGTDMHSKTAEQLSEGKGVITRNQAKAFNYARIYGAGKGLARVMMSQAQPHLSQEEISASVNRMYNITKGERCYKLTSTGYRLALAYLDNNEIIENRGYITDSALKELCSLTGYSQYALVQKRVNEYIGGSESKMFNKLEAIAKSDTPTTPVLQARISRPLEPAVIGNNNMTSRVNWVVQSSAVDFLHLLLVSMEWIMKEYEIEGRFSISIHDEVRFHVPEDQVYQTALALQLSNLLTRALFAVKLGFTDLPNNVAFFSAVDIDKVLRKDVNDDCVTPSNPLGLHKGYGIPPGQELDINQLIEKLGVLRKRD